MNIYRVAGNMKLLHNLSNDTFQHVDIGSYQWVRKDDEEYQDMVYEFFDTIPEKYLSMLAASRTYLIMFYKNKAHQKENSIAVVAPFDPPIMYNQNLTQEELKALRKRELYKFIKGKAQ